MQQGAVVNAQRTVLIYRGTDEHGESNGREVVLGDVDFEPLVYLSLRETVCSFYLSVCQASVQAVRGSSRTIVLSTTSASLRIQSAIFGPRSFKVLQRILKLPATTSRTE